MALTAKKVYAILKRQISDMEAKIKTPIIYRGTVATADLLPENPKIGDMYNIESKSIYGEAGMNVAWNGVVWDTMGAPIDMSLYIKSSELADWVKQQNKPTYTAEEVGALPADAKIPSKTSELKNDSGFLTKVPDGYLNGTDTTLKESGKAADAKATGDKFTEMSADISKKLDKNQGSENSGRIAGINESGDIVPMFPVGVEYNEETNCLEFGSDQKMELNQGIGLDSTLTKTGFAADAGATGKEISSLKEDTDNLFKDGVLIEQFKFEQGGVYGNGDLFNTNASVRTGLITLAQAHKFVVPNNKKVFIFAYDKITGAFKRPMVTNKSEDFYFNGNDNYRIVVNNADDSNLTPEQIGITIYNVDGVITNILDDIKTAPFLYGTDVGKNDIKFDSFERGGIKGDGSEFTNDTEIRTKSYVSVYSTMQVYIKDNMRKFYVFEYASDYHFIKTLASGISNQIVTLRANYNYRIVVKNNDNTVVPLNTIITWNNVAFIRDFKQNLYESLPGQNSTKLILPAFEKGGLYGNGSESPENDTDIRSQTPIYIPAGNYAVTNPRKHFVYILLYKADLTYIGNAAWNDNSEYIPFIVLENSYMRLVEKDSAGIEPSETSVGLYIDNALNTNIGYYKNGIIIASKEGENLGVPPASLLSIKEAFKNGYDAYRLNVCKTSDDYYVLSHNRSINEVARNSNGTVIQETINIDQHTLDELNQYDYGIKYGTQFTGMKITQFDDAMSLCAKLGLRLDIEWKYPTMIQTDAENLYTAIVTHGYTNKNWHWVAYDTNMINAFKSVCDYVNIEILVDPKNIDWNLIDEASSEKHDVVVGYSSSQGSPSTADIVKLRKLNVVQNKGTATNLEQMIEQINNGVTEIEANFAMPKKALINFALKI